jgi:uncharacterized protein (DUF1330 family)
MGNFLSQLGQPPVHHRAYYIAMLSVQDAETFNEYLVAFHETTIPFGGTSVAQTTDLASPDSFADHAEGFHRCFVMDFPSIKAAQDWFNSDAYQTIVSLRRQSSSGPVVLATGISTNEKGQTTTDSGDQAIVVAFAKAPPIPHEDQNTMLIGPSLKRFQGHVVLNCALKPDHSFENKVVEFEDEQEKLNDEFDFCFVLSFPTMEQAKAWRASDAYPHLHGPLVALPLVAGDTN